MFVGRERELTQFEGAIATATAGGAAVVLVLGEAGIGKSTLVAHAAAAAGVELVVGRSSRGSAETIPFASLVDILRAVRRAHPELLDSPDAEALEQLVSRRAAVTGPESSPLAVFDATLTLLARLAAVGTRVVLFEDLQWADPLTWDLFDFLARYLVDEGVVVVGTYRAGSTVRDVEDRRRLAELSRLPLVRRIQPGRLARGDVARLTAAVVGDAVPPEVVDEIMARGDGNPLFTEELAAASAAGESIPQLLSDLFAADIGHLDHDAKAVLAALATLGRETPDALLRAVVDVDDAALDKALHAALAADVIVLDERADGFAFRHALIGDVVASQLLPSERRRLHGRIADTLVTRPELAATPTMAAGELAFHLERAGDVTGAFHAMLRASDELQCVAPAAALAQVERALALWDQAGAPDDERAPREWQAAELAYVTGDGARAVTFATEALARRAPSRGEAWGHERLARYLWTAGRLAESEVEYRLAAALVDPDDRTVDTAIVCAGLAQGEFLFCRYAAAQTWCEQALAVVTDPDVDRATWVHATRVLGLVHSHLGDTDAAIALCERAAAAAELPDDRALATIYLAESLLHAARFDAAVAVALDGAAEGQRAGFDRSMGGYLSAMAVEGLTRLGRWSEARALLERLAGVDAVPPTALRLRVAAAALAARRGERERARAEIARAEQLQVDPWHVIHLSAGRADVALLCGEPAVAASAAGDGWTSECGRDHRWPARFALLAVAAEVEQALDALARREPVDVDAVVACLAQRVADARTACTRPDTGELPVGVAPFLAHAEASITRLTTGDPEAWARAAAAWDEHADRWGAAVARVREAEAAAAVGEAARASDALRAAHHTAVELQARPLLADIDAVATRTRLRVEQEPVTALGASDASRLGLTSREAEVLALVAAGRTNRQIGAELFVSEKTVSVHVSNILRKLGATSRVEAAAVAQRLGMA